MHERLRRGRGQASEEGNESVQMGEILCCCHSEMFRFLIREGAVKAHCDIYEYYHSYCSQSSAALWDFGVIDFPK